MADTQNVENTQDNGKAPRKAGRLRLAAGLVVLVALVGWIGHWFWFQSTHVTGDDAQIVANEITVSSRLSGRLSEFSLIQGDTLKKDSVVASLYSRPDELQLASLQAKVEGMKAELAYQKQRLALSSDQLQGGIRETRDELEADQATLEAAQAVMDSAEKTYHRSKSLSTSGAVSQQKLDEDYYTYLTAKADYERARRQVTVDRTALDNSRIGLMSGPTMSLPNPELLKAQLQVTQQSLAQAEADLRHQQVQVDDLTIRSPRDGVVDKTFVDPGEYLSAGQPVLMMHTPGDVWVEAKIKETKIGDLQVGQPVALHVDALPDRMFKGHVQVIGNAATNQFALLPNPNPSGNFTKITQRIPVRIAIDEGPKERLSPGMMVVVDIDISGDGQGS